jgi:micrococcal nuclease
LLALRVGYDRWWSDSVSAPRASLDEGLYAVVRVVDGDTLIVRPASAPATGRTSSAQFPVRLLGIDCPETVHPEMPVQPWGPEAAAFTRTFVSGGSVRLQFDKRRIDRYGRYLAYVLAGEQMLNEALVAAGLARVEIYPGDSQSIERRLRAAEQQAREAGCGIWSSRR